MKLSKYPRLKSSGIEWLGRVPQHWLVDRLKRSVDGCRNGIWGDDADDGVNDIVCIRVADFDRVAFRVIENPQTLRAIPRRERATRELKDDDLLIEKSGGGEKQLVGCVVSFNHSFEAVSSNFVARMRPLSGMHSRYWTYAHASLYAGRVNYPSIKQTTGIQNLDTGAYLNERFVFPPFEEQRAIADFLDRETARLDTLVGKKRELIEKLKEKRTALISRTVTRGLPAEVAVKAGLNLHPELKPSGIEWLGDIPKHWTITALKRLARPGRKTFTDGDWVELPFITDAGVRLIQTGNVGIGNYKEQGFRYISEESFEELGCTEIAVGDVLICRLDGPVGRACLAPKLPERMITSVDNTILKVRADVSASFVVYLLSSAAWLCWIEALCRVGGGFRMRISRTMLGNIRIGLPVFPEQRAIADYLDRETAKIDKMMEKVEAAIGKLQEYRTALITAAVTGKIDVRGEANSVGSTGALAAGTLPA